MTFHLLPAFRSQPDFLRSSAATSRGSCPGWCLQCWGRFPRCIWRWSRSSDVGLGCADTQGADFTQMLLLAEERSEGERAATAFIGESGKASAAQGRERQCDTPSNMDLIAQPDSCSMAGMWYKLVFHKPRPEPELRNIKTHNLIFLLLFFFSFLCFPREKPQNEKCQFSKEMQSVARTLQGAQKTDKDRNVLSRSSFTVSQP